MAVDVSRGGRSEVRVEAIEWEGKPRIDLRLWVWAEDLGRMLPTRRGLSIRLDQVQRVHDEIQAAVRSFSGRSRAA